MPETQPAVNGRMQVSEKIMPSLNDLKQGQTVNLIINYKVMERTKNYTVLKIKHVEANTTRRIF